MRILFIHIVIGKFAFYLDGESIQDLPRGVKLLDGRLALVESLHLSHVSLLVKHPIEVRGLHKLGDTLCNVLLDILNFFEELLPEGEGFLTLVLGKLGDD